MMRETFQQDSFNQSTGPHQSNSDLNEISLIKSEDLNTRNKNEPSEIIKLNNLTDVDESKVLQSTINISGLTNNFYNQNRSNFSNQNHHFQIDLS